MKEKQGLSSCAPVIEADRGRPQEAPSPNEIESIARGLRALARFHDDDAAGLRVGHYTAPTPHNADIVKRRADWLHNVSDRLSLLAALGPSTADIDEERA